MLEAQPAADSQCDSQPLGRVQAAPRRPAVRGNDCDCGGLLPQCEYCAGFKGWRAALRNRELQEVWRLSHEWHDEFQVGG
jgi:hypothetical protein